MAHTHSHAAGDDNAKRLLLAFGVTATFMIIEVIGGLVSGSLALLADAGHMLTDAAALLFALLAVQFARRPPNTRHTFGWLRLTTLAAFVNAIALVVITILIVWAVQTSSADCRGDNDGDCRGRAGGEYPGLLDFAPRQRGKEPQRARGGSACAGGFARFSRGDCRRAGDPLYRLDACRSDFVRAGVVSGLAQRLAAAEGERE